MEEKHPTTAVNPFLTSYALVAINKCLFELLCEVPSDKHERSKYFDDIYGLAFAGKIFSQQLNDYLNEIDEAGYRIPLNSKDVYRVEEPPAVYAVKR
ncbi:MAG: hypothetical protein MJA83_12525 [Gammaproteobacteria bacterium]|nr:hypothetical protein [Gammaproteobacteria bacterium]